MRVIAVPLMLVTSALSFVSVSVHADVIKTLSVSQIHPTQPAIGYNEVRLKIALMKQDPKRLFNSFCENNGAGKVVTFDAKSDITQPKSFQCAKAWGSDIPEVKSAVLAPDNQVYLTDGHHTVSIFRDFAGNKDFQYQVRITDDFSKLADMAEFWKTMEQRNLTWLTDPQGNPVAPQTLPSQVGIKYMQDDGWRSVVYFLRDIAYEKPDNAPPFLEFFLGNWLRTNVPLHGDELSTEQGYAAYLSRAAKALTQADGSQKATNAPNSPTLTQLGKMSTVNQAKLDELSSKDGKLAILFNSMK